MPSKFMRLIGGAVVGLSLFGFAFQSQAQLSRNETQSLLNRLNQLETQIQTMSRYVYRGEGEVPTAAVSSSNGDLGAGYVAQIEDRLTAMERQIRDLTNSVERMQFQLAGLDTKINGQQDVLKTLQEKPVQPSKPLYDSSIPKRLQETIQNKPSSDLTGDVPVPSDTAGSQYDRAFGLLKEQNYDVAEKEFTIFLENYPNHDLADNARYWLAETYYVRGNNEKAAVLFAEAYQKNTAGNKAPDNLLKLGMSLNRLGKKNDACLTFVELEKNFPNAAIPIRQRTEQQKKLAGCL